MLATPELIETSEQLTAVIHLTVPCAEIGNVMSPAIAEILAAIAAAGVAPSGPCFSYHFRRPTDSFDFELGFPVAQAIAAQGRVKMSRLPATRVARTIYQGGYEGLGSAWGEFLQWIETSRLATQDHLWECYLSGPESSADPATWRTELYRPLK